LSYFIHIKYKQTAGLFFPDTNIKIAWQVVSRCAGIKASTYVPKFEGLPRTNTLAYHEHLNYGQKSFITLTLVTNVIKLFHLQCMNYRSKLER
jgi:hypothetical protein